MNKLEAVFFDLDGTLINTISDIAHSYNHALEEHGLPTHDVESYKLFVGNGAKVLSERICGKNLEKAEAVHNLAQEYYSNNLTTNSEPYIGIVDAIEVLQSRGVKMAVLTNKPHEHSKRIINSFFPKHTFEKVCGMKDGILPKPNTDQLLQMCKDIDVEPKNCMFVGDSSVDMQLAKKADMVAVGVEWGFRSVEELEENQADVILEEPADITSLPEIFEDLDN